MCDDGCAKKIIEHVATFAGFGTDTQATVEKACGRYVRGKNKGKLRGWAHVEVVAEGGWQVLGQGERNGRVLYPNTITKIVISDFAGKELLMCRR